LRSLESGHPESIKQTFNATQGQVMNDLTGESGYQLGLQGKPARRVGGDGTR
jgi:hypothetical protein